MRIEAKQLRGERKVKLHEAVPLAGPWSMWLDVTNYCNFRCIYCPTGNADMLAGVNRGTGSMSMELIDKVIRDLREMPQLKIIGFYKDGEPLVHPQFTEIVSRFKAAGVSEQLWVKTNGELLDRHKDLSTCGLDMVGVSVPHVHEEGIYHTVGRRLDYAKYVDGVKRLFESDRTFKLYVKIGDWGLTDEEKDKFYHDFEPISDYCSVEGLHGWTASDRKLLLKDRGTVDGVPFTKKVVCPLPFYMMSINFDGTVGACNDDWGHFHQLGDVKAQSIKEIWDGDKFKAFRLLHLDGRREENRACHGCQYIETLPDNIDQYREEMRNAILSDM